jgi:hypothetical protein
LELGLKAKERAKVSKLGQMARNMKDSGKEISITEKAY